MLLVQKKRWIWRLAKNDLIVCAKYLQDFLIRHALSGWQNGTCGWNEAMSQVKILHLLLVAQNVLQ